MLVADVNDARVNQPRCRFHCSDSSERTIDHTPALFFDVGRAKAVLDCLNRADLSRYHFREVIEDILAE